MRALVIVDVQNDFCEGGALAVAGGEAVSKNIFYYVKNNSSKYETIVFTKDWHRPWPDTNGEHFSETPDFVDTWPVHCVQGTKGAEFELYTEELFDSVHNPRLVFRKGDGRPDYSGFQGLNKFYWTLAEWLDEHDVTEIDVVGIAGDHCVRATALDAVRLGYKVNVLPGLVASVGGEDATMKMLKEVDNAQRV